MTLKSWSLNNLGIRMFKPESLVKGQGNALQSTDTVRQKVNLTYCDLSMRHSTGDDATCLEICRFLDEGLP
ncbi:MAG: hypothetical protein AAFX78_05930 [Cyanobacteria bacterium J06638_20]